MSDEELECTQTMILSLDSISNNKTDETDFKWLQYVWLSTKEKERLH